MLSFCLVCDVGGCMGDSAARCFGGWEKSFRTSLGRQNGCSRFSGTLLMVVSLRLSVADVENDRLGKLVGSARVRVLQARRRDPNRRRTGSWVLLFDAGSSSLMGDGGVTWQMGVFGGGRGCLGEPPSFVANSTTCRV